MAVTVLLYHASLTLPERCSSMMRRYSTTLSCGAKRSSRMQWPCPFLVRIFIFYKNSVRDPFLQANILKLYIAIFTKGFCSIIAARNTLENNVFLARTFYLSCWTVWEMQELLMVRHCAILLTYCAIRCIRGYFENYLVDGTSAESFSVDITPHK